ncbi:hypothetical protein INR49_000986, partial [Caranx melampygus]
MVVVVSTSMPQRMNIYHFKKGTEICNYSYPNNILAVKLNRQRLVVCLEESIYIHNIKDMKLLKTLLNTPTNPSGNHTLSLCSLHQSFQLLPGISRQCHHREIIVYDANNLVRHCHPSVLHSEGLRLFEFRRGMKRYVNISSYPSAMTASSSVLPAIQRRCISLNWNNLDQACCPVHSGGDEAATWTAYMGKMFSAASSYLPAQVSGMMSQDRAFAIVHLVSSGQKNVCTLAMIQKLPRLLVATTNGHLFIYNVDPLDGGECTLAHKH